MATSIQNIREADAPPQRAYSWEVEVLATTLINAPAMLTARAENINIPEKSFETIEINYKSRKSRYSGRDAAPGTVTVTFWDDESHAIYNFIDKWMEEGISNSTTGGGRTRPEYVAELRAKLMGHDEQTVTGTHVFKNVWPSSLGEITLDYTASDHVSFTVTFTYDTHEKDGGEGGGNVGGGSGGGGIWA